MRLEFIHPIFLPPLNECFLRKDFNFAKYLAFCYGKTLSNFFNTSWVALLIILVSVNASKLVFISNEAFDHIKLISILPPVFFLGVFLIFEQRFKRIERLLYPHIKKSDGEYLKPEEMNF